MTTATEEARAALREDLRRSTRGLGLSVEQVRAAKRPGPRRLRRGPRGRTLLEIRLIDEDGVLRWAEGPVAPRARRPGLRMRRRAAEIEARHVDAIPFEQIAPSEITAHLDGLDRKLTPYRGLRRWHEGKLVPVQRVDAREGERVLLIVHGTFSHGEAIIDQIAGAPNGRAFLQSCASIYDQILTFDHPTLAVSPLLNAMQLEQALGNCPARIDVIAHSRGGLVARAWASAFRPGGQGLGRLVLVGSPLGGTSLAAPPRLRQAMQYVTNVGRVLGKLFSAGAANPFLAVGAGIMQVITSVTSVTANTPLLDAAVAMIPGLAAQSRVGNNHEVLWLRDLQGTPADRCFAVRADFEPPPVGWEFWKLFCHPRQRLADFGADLLFPGANDLVVDCDSTVSLGDEVEIPSTQLLDFRTTSAVHHCNYFAQKETLRFLGETLLGD